MKRTRISLISVTIVVAILLPSNSTLGVTDIDWHFRDHPQIVVEAGRQSAPVALILDDGSTEGDFGVGANTAQQFLWFNQFPGEPLPFHMDEIQVLFSPGPNMAVGNAVELVVYHDPDRDPGTGANLLATYAGTIQVLDGVSFSVYPLDPPLSIPAGGDILVGVINRFVVSGVTGPTDPAALDTTTGQARSWLAIWSTDPPAVPTLPSDLYLGLVDVFQAGNWMIRAYGFQASPVQIPAVQPWGLGLLILLLLAAAIRHLRAG
jgi:hypothetical protein